MRPMPVELELSSPDAVRLSLASALALQMRSGRFYRNVHNGCINLLLTYPETCRVSCDYCGLARERASSPAVPVKAARRTPPNGRSFIRVEWPLAPTAEILMRLSRRREAIRRVCLSMVVHPRAYPDTLTIVRQLTEARSGLPLSVLVAPPMINEARLRELQRAGVERIGIGLDAVNEPLFRRRRHGLAWPGYWRAVAAARKVYGPDRVNCHLVVGLGETDAELIEVCFRLRAMQVSSYLFSFYPESGTPMAHARRPSLVRWRRLQLASFLIEQNSIQPEQVVFDHQGRLARLEVGLAELSSVLADGRPFVTRGCPGGNDELACTRPFGSYRPGEPFRDYPFQPEPDDLQKIKEQLRLERLDLG
ncbi:MAG: hypothetical protein A3G20_09545 [Acidobacteria bacterium RIFCSPLOWO2_12_FULL_59_11]|nr:MAG: hypothetical protein A3G20_09545 [Acidobacteria bacterium RIFCSPLOWO2_12_FULL_59_11]